MPLLGLPAVKAKVDTGAKTSSLHAFTIDTFGPIDRQKVRFGVHPIPGRDDVSIQCTADIVDRREVTSSNGESELRYVIRTPVTMGTRTWPIEITLANRETMAYRMLLGRSALQEDMVVDPTSSFVQPKLSYKVYGPPQALPAESQALKIALMTRRPDNPSVRRLIRSAERRGHSVVIVDRSRLSLYIATTQPAIYLDGRPLENVNAILTRAGSTLSAFSLAALRQFENMGAIAINPADALARLNDSLAIRQTLARAGIAITDAAVSDARLLKSSRSEGHVMADSTAMLGGGNVVRIAVVAGRALAELQRSGMTSLDDPPEWQAVGAETSKDHAEVRHLAEAAARALGLGLAAVDIAISRTAATVIDVEANVSISQFDRLCGTSLGDSLIVHLEQEARQRLPRASAEASPKPSR